MAKKLSVSSNTVVYWMDQFSIKRRTRKEAMYVKYNRSGDPFRLKMNLDEYENFLFGLSLGLFWGEGMKRNKSSVRLGNTDPFLILYFREFLMKICGVKKEKIKYSLQLFGDSNEKRVARFWCDILQISRSQLGKIGIIKLRGKGTYRFKNQYGVLQISCHNSKLKGIIDNFLRTLKISIYADVAQMVEHVHGETHESLAQMLEN